MIAFTETRARSTDPVTSHIAAKNAASGKAKALRLSIATAIWACGPMTARELSVLLGADYYDVQRRISETAGIRKTGEIRDGAMVWSA